MLLQIYKKGGNYSAKRAKNNLSPHFNLSI